MNKGILLFLLTVFCTINSANSTETTWKTQGYGYVFHTVDNKTTAFDLTTKHCLENHLITDEFEQISFIEETQKEKMALKIDTQLKRPDTVKSDLEMVVSSRRSSPGDE